MKSSLIKEVNWSFYNLVIVQSIEHSSDNQTTAYCKNQTSDTELKP
jgi:hypothetical protein